MTFGRGSILALGLLSGALALGAQPARAQNPPRDAQSIETARDLYNQGKKLRDAGELKAALEKFKAAHALAHTPITGLDLAKTHASLNQPVDAREVCLDIARTPVAREETARSAEARRDAAKLAEQVIPQIASLSLRIEGLEAGQIPRVTVDQSIIPYLALTELRKVNPGAHTITASVEGGSESSESVDVKSGETKTVTVTVIQPPTAPKPPVDPRPQPTAVAPLMTPPTAQEEAPKKHVLVPIGLATGIAGGVVGSITGIVALSKKSDLNSACPDKHCPPEVHSQLDSARAMGTVSTVAFGVGIAGFGLFLIGSFLPTERARPSEARSVTPWFSGSSVGLDGRF